MVTEIQIRCLIEPVQSFMFSIFVGEGNERMITKLNIFTNTAVIFINGVGSWGLRNRVASALVSVLNFSK